MPNPSGGEHEPHPSSPTDSSRPTRETTDADRRLANMIRRGFMETTTDMMHCVDAEGNIIYVNQAHIDALGYTRDELLGMNIRVFVDESAHGRVPYELETLRRDRRVFIPEAIWKRKDGTRFPCEVSAVADLGPNGAVRGAYVVARDISERRRVETELRRTAEQLGATLAALPDLMFEVDEDGRIFDFRAPDPTLLYRPPEQFLGKTMKEVLPPEAGQVLTRAIERAAATGEPTTVEYPLTTPAGDGWFEASLAAKGDRRSPDRRVILLVRDMTERKRTQEALRKSEDLQRTVLDQMQEAVVFADEQGIVRHINAFACDYLNTTREEAVGQDLLRFHSAEIHARIREIIRTFQTDPTAQVVSRQRSLGNRELIFRFSAVRDTQGTYRGIIANLIDVTEIKRLEAGLQQAQKMESIGRLAGGIAHHFNNLMVTVTGLASLLQRRFGPDHPEADKLREIEQAGTRASNLANQLVAYARTGRHHPRRINLNDTVRSVLLLCESGLPGRVSIETHLDPDLPPVHADPLQMEQVVMNLCLNAAEATDESGRIDIATSVGPLEEELRGVHPELVGKQLVCLTVRDNGCGMDEATATKAFEPYFTTKDRAPGLGLASVHGIVRNHGGHVQIESRPGQGTAVRILLPACADRE